MPQPVVTRFAPSPTGYLHIGGARTALFNWLFAQHHGGKMLLRIEDTDRARSTPEAVDALIDGLTWLGLDWEGDPISQFSRADRHREVAEALVSQGKAYYCYATPEELTEMREKAREEGRFTGYDGRWRDRDPSEAPEGVDPVIRIKTPLDGETIVDDAVQGTVTFANKDIDDFVILRSDGTPTYMLAVVVDDHDMGITHVIRGDDHLTNAARQSVIFNVMDWDVPTFAHIPLIHGPDGAKLSKRHGATGAEAYRAMGYLPQAMRNYLVRLGWAKGDEEIISLDDMIEWFGFEGMGKSASRFDFAKLEALNAHYIKESDETELLELLKTITAELEANKEEAELLLGERLETFKAALPLLKDRAKLLPQLFEQGAFIAHDCPLPMTEKATALLTEEAKEVLKGLGDSLSTVDQWDHDTIAETTKTFAKHAGLKLGKVGQPLRAALAGTTDAPGIFDILLLLGKEESLKRISDVT